MLKKIMKSLVLMMIFTWFVLPLFPDAVMIIHIKSRDNVPGVEKVLVKPGRLNHQRLAFQMQTAPVPGENDRPLLFLRDSSGKTIYKTAFDFPVARTVPPLPDGKSDPSCPDVIFIKDPDIFLVAPYFKEVEFIEIYNPYASTPAAMMACDKINLHYETGNKTVLPLPGPEPPPAELGKFHVLVIASGFSAADMSEFTARAAQLENYILAREPFQSFSSLIEVHIYENTVDLGCYSGCNGIDRLLCCSTSQVISAAASSGYLFDEIIVLHNTDVYCGGGYREYMDAYKTNSYSSYAASYKGDRFKEVVLHEFGHSFGNLCDEYSYNTEGISYNNCVNCRDNCDEWAAISSACQQGCAAKQDYFRPQDSIMLTLNITDFNPVSIYAAFLPDGLEKRLRFFTGQEYPVKITLQATRKEENAWIIRQQYGVIDLTVENPDSISISKLILYRKRSEENYQAIKEIPGSQLQNQGCSYVDTFLEKDVTYTYKAETVYPDGRVSGVSNPGTI
jgi:hypothetical protein